MNRSKNYYAFINLALVSAMASLLFVNFSFSQIETLEEVDLTAEERQWIFDHPTLKATNQTTWAPIDFSQGDNAAGYSVDYLNLIAQKVGFKVKYVNGYQWKELLELLKSREIDIAQSITYTEDRGQYLDFTDPYLEIRKVFFGRTGNERVNTIDDLVDKRIGVIGVWANSENIREKHPTLNFIDFQNSEDAMSALSNDEIDIFSVRFLIGNYIIKQNFYTEIEMVGRDLFDRNLSNNYIRLASRNDEPILNSILSKGMTAVTEQETNALSRKWRNEFYSNESLNLSSPELEWLSDHPVVRVASDPNATPIEFIDNDGKVSGIAGAYLTEIEKKLGVKFEWIGNQTWQQGLNAIKSGDADIVSVVTPTSERGEYLNFTENYVNIAHMIFGRDGEEVFSNMDGLKGYKIVQVTGNAVTAFIERDYPDLNIIKVGSAVEALRLLSIGEVDAYIATIPAASQKIASEGLTNVVVAGETPYRGEYAIGVRADLTLLNSAMQKAMHSFTDEERAAISRNWLVLKIQEKIDNAFIGQILGIALAIFAIILIWNYSLRLEVSRRKEVESKLLLSQSRAEIAQAEAEAANAAKSTFLANMSHEIRTPLNAIIGFSDAMLMGIFGTIKEPRYQAYLADIKGSGEHLATVINDILDLSKIESGKWKLRESEFSLDECIEDAMTILTLQATNKKISLEYEMDTSQSSFMIFGDMSTIKRTIINLLSNAVKFTTEEGFVRCHVGLSVNGDVKIGIVDTGIGIPADRIENVLNPFEQCEEESYINEEGTGLGLSIVKKLVELHGGTFRLESEVGVGTSATIILPKKRLIPQKNIAKKRQLAF